ncbi:hypothetical protein [Streptomyces yunnanensis]|uniref:DUF7739 domain-containing protein n=1 Tax=Streptomyces yunnanensis TaxID=156453 RepID=A0A9X8MTC5_9ACTN|nr:hypothetical protein [Streptomyces yunnanensis]SHL75228.1 hypothetical protein SAMN05216268_10675 [Streptomyces yunnanensis]
MGWTISHGVQNTRSATTIHNLAQHLAHVLSASDWRAIEPVFGYRSGDPFQVPHADARRLAAVLRRAANHRKMPADWGALARELADSAERAASARQPWKWR